MVIQGAQNFESPSKNLLRRRFLFLRPANGIGIMRNLQVKTQTLNNPNFNDTNLSVTVTNERCWWWQHTEGLLWIRDYTHTHTHTHTQLVLTKSLHIFFSSYFFPFFFFFCGGWQAMTCSLQDLSSLTRDWTWALSILAVKAWNLNHWTTRESPTSFYFLNK